MMLRSSTTSLFGALPEKGTASSGKERNTARPGVSKPAEGYFIPQGLPETDSKTMGVAAEPGVNVSEKSGP